MNTQEVWVGGRRATVVTLEDGQGLRVRLLSRGATVVSIEAPDATGRPERVALAFDDVAAYAHGHAYLGATVGRFANRIAGAAFSIDGERFAVDANDGPNHLHGGHAGFHSAAFEVLGVGPATALFRRTSPDGEGGYPGNLSVTVRYRVARGALRIDFGAQTDRPTIVNLTHHTYFNLSGGTRDASAHRLCVEADRYVPLDGRGIPLGRIEPVEGTVFDFRRERPIGDGLSNGALADRGGYDHPYILNRPAGALRHAARLREPESGRALDVFTTEPALHVYTGQWLGRERGSIAPRAGAFAGVCLETGRPPDCPNQAQLGSARLDPGQRYRHTVIYRFTAVR